MKIKNKGFTLIELLVVIAIIGILSSVVLASLNSARSKGSNAAVKSNLQGIRSQAEIVFDNNSQDYSSMCADTNVVNAVIAAMTAGADAAGLADYQANGNILARCNAVNSEWAVNTLLNVPDNGNDYWCTDHTGVSKGEVAELAGATSCA